jgi:predicted GIY-YIG superfamily endonuclease
LGLLALATPELRASVFKDIVQAINREKEIKNLSRDDKFELIRKSNPNLKKIELN